MGRETPAQSVGEHLLQLCFVERHLVRRRTGLSYVVKVIAVRFRPIFDVAVQIISVPVVSVVAILLNHVHQLLGHRVVDVAVRHVRRLVVLDVRRRRRHQLHVSVAVQVGDVRRALEGVERVGEPLVIVVDDGRTSTKDERVDVGDVARRRPDEAGEQQQDEATSNVHRFTARHHRQQPTQL